MQDVLIYNMKVKCLGSIAERKIIFQKIPQLVKWSVLPNKWKTIGEFGFKFIKAVSRTVIVTDFTAR